MEKQKSGNLLIAQGGGPTAVINGSLMGVINEAKKHSEIDGIYGARFGIEGLLNEDLIDLRQENSNEIEKLAFTPASALGSCRRKLKESDYPEVIKILRKYNIKYFFYNGGNDSMDTCSKIYKIAGNEIMVIGIPKTIDNDLGCIDHCPGYGSAARYIIVSTAELAKDVESLPIHVCVMEVMGRNAGWLTAAASLAKRSEKEGPHLVYVPERPFDENKFIQDVKNCHEQTGGVLVVVSEGLKDKDGNCIAHSGIVDGFGHKVPGGVAQHLSNVIMNNLGIKSRSEKPGLLGRVSIAHQSYTDRNEAISVGEFAVKSAVLGKSGYMVSIRRISNIPYKSEMELVKLSDVANIERTLPDEYINEDGNGITEEFREYCLPLLGNELPDYADLKKISVARLEEK